MKLVGQDKAEVPNPTGTWVLVRKDTKSNLSGLELPDSYAGKFEFFIQAIGPDLVDEHWPIGAKIELNPKLALARAVMLSDSHCLVPYDSIVGVYPGTAS